METLEQGVKYEVILTIKTPERRRWKRCKYFTPCSSVSIVNFEQVNAGWVTNFTVDGMIQNVIIGISQKQNGTS